MSTSNLNTDPRGLEGLSQPAAPKSSGRPRKFIEPSHPITVTLPERTLEALATISDDRAKAIVMAVDTLRPPDNRSEHALVQVIKASEKTSMIVVGANQLLSAIPFLGLAEVAPGRYLLHLISGTSLADLEVALDDILEGDRGTDIERAMVAQLRMQLKKVRRTRSVHKAEVLIVHTE
ncbi:MAG TPA: hypothetical protein PKE26_09585 [Kiritimatiellia bacterium]|nr:hypothetical protein [Kiritimatiellia bacterium]HMO99347.1 hypothetical protein [Kiritimatiellia bacterium]HMP97441.1 hypothetical protein [Kiritimatiellia bacterium]